MEPTMTIPDHPYRLLIEEACKYAYPVPPNVLEAMVWMESNFNPNAKSKSNARGLGQLIPKWHADGVGRKVAADLGLTLTDDLWYDPQFSLYCAARHLKYCYGECGSWETAVAKYHSGQCHPPADFVDGQGTSTVYHLVKFREALAQVEAHRTSAPPGGNDMAGMKAYTFVGAKGPVWLPDWIDVQIKIVNHSNVRSYQKSPGMTTTTWHDTGNPNTNADAEYKWLVAGRPGGGAGGYSFIFDDRKIIQCVPLDEVTWHAGTTTGNRTSFGSEQAWGTGVNFQKSIEVGAALHGGLCAMMGWEVDTHLVPHRIWYGKWCPGQILNRGIWSYVVKMTGDAAVKAKGASTGGQVPKPQYETPVAIPQLEQYKSKPEAEVPYRVILPDGTVCIYVGDRVKATKNTPRYRYSEGNQRVGPDIQAGDEFDVDWLLMYPGRDDIYLSPYNTRILVKDTQRISDVQSAA